MSKFLKGIAVSLALVAMLFTVVGIAAVAPKTASAAVVVKWGLGTKINGSVGDSNPWQSYYEICWGEPGWPNTQSNPAWLFTYDPITRGYSYCSMNWVGMTHEHYFGFQFDQVTAHWIKFTIDQSEIPSVSQHAVHYYQPYIYRTHQIKGLYMAWNPYTYQYEYKPSWNMIGSPYSMTGQGLNTVPTPGYCFEFCYAGVWKNLPDARAAGWVTSLWGWDCDSQTYKYIDTNTPVPYGHGLWILSYQDLDVRVARPPGVLSYPTGANGDVPVMPGCDGIPGMQGQPPSPY